MQNSTADISAEPGLAVSHPDSSDQAQLRIGGEVSKSCRPCQRRGSLFVHVCMHDYIAISTRTLTPPTTGTD